MQCTYIKKDKQQCHAHSLRDSPFCFRHDSKHTSEAVQASKTGGMNRDPSLSFPEEFPLKTTVDIQQLIAKTINAIWQGKISTKVGTSTGFLARCWLDANEKAEFEKRIASLEEKMRKLG